MTACKVDDKLGGQDLKRLLGNAVGFFKSQVEAINRLNVFPVPDGDTGINMYHTVLRAFAEISQLQSDNASTVARAFAQGALMGARGNSGTILSQLFKGFAQGLADAETLSECQFVAACERAVALAYDAVSEPVEGTILTVAREAAESLSQRQNERRDLSAQFQELLRTAERSLRETPNRLPVLKQAGVVDAGAMGLLVFLQGMLDSTGRTLPTDFDREPPAERFSLDKLSAPANHYGYDVQFLMRGASLDLNTIRRDLGRMGWSVLVVGDEALVKVHIHVDNPADPLDYAYKSTAELDDIVVENMGAQYRRHVQELQQNVYARDSAEHRRGIAVISVVEGAGLKDIFKDLGCAAIIEGGQGQNPSVEEFVELIRQTTARQLIILPNNRNIALAARQAAEFVTEKEVRVVPSRSLLQGIAAMLAFDDRQSDADDSAALARAMAAAMEQVTSIEITCADRSGQLDGVDFLQGDYIAIVDGALRAAARSVADVLQCSFQELELEARELATVYRGETTSEAEAAQLVERLTCIVPELEFELVCGGQSLYPYLIGVE